LIRAIDAGCCWRSSATGGWPTLPPASPPPANKDAAAAPDRTTRIPPGSGSDGTARSIGVRSAAVSITGAGRSIMMGARWGFREGLGTGGFVIGVISGYPPTSIVSRSVTYH